jgi:hypothetical protein
MLLSRASPDFSQFFPGCEQARPDGSDGNLQNRRQFGIGVAFHLAEPQERSLFRGQTAQGVAHDDVLLSAAILT